MLATDYIRGRSDEGSKEATIFKPNENDQEDGRQGYQGKEKGS